MKQLDYEKYIVKILSQEVAFNWKLPFAIESAYQAIGTGFFIDNHGLILTCGHVLEKSIKIFVEIPFDGFRRYDADIVGFCPSDQLDIGLIRLRNYKSANYLKLGDSNKLRRGMRTLAVGFPLGQSYLKYTEGIVSGFQDGVIQTDTPINPGNSGGPLIYDGKVVGIVVSKMALAENVGYAVPIAQYYPIKDRLHDGLARIPRLGIEYNETDNKIKRHFKSKCKEGIYISAIYPDAPIAKSGIKRGAILCSFDGHQLDSNGLIRMPKAGFKIDIYNYCKFLSMDSNIKLEWYQDNKLKRSSFKLSEYIFPVRIKYPVFEKVSYIMIGGIVLMDLTLNHVALFPRKLSKYIDPAERTVPKIVLASVLPGSSASKTEILEAGDIIIRINDIEVNQISDVKKIIEKLGISDIVLENERNNVYITDKKTVDAEMKMLAKFYGLN